MQVQVSIDLKELIPNFFQEIREELVNMKYALEEKDFETLIRLGHGFKGAARNCQLNDLAENFLVIEKAAKNQNIEAVKKHMEKTNDYIEQLQIEYVGAQ